MEKFNLNDHTHRLLLREPFFASLSRRIEKSPSTAIPTAGVRVREDGFFEMLYNPSFFEKLTDSQRAGVLIHEFYHLVFEHIVGRLPDELEGVMKNKNPSSKERNLFKLWNIATDLSINCLIGQENLPEGCCFPGHDKFAEFHPNQSAEFYYAQLKKQAEENPSSEGDSSEGDDAEGSSSEGDDAEQFDSHEMWGGSSQVAEDIAKERLKEAIKEAASDASKTGSWGSISADCRKEIMDRISSKIDWRKVLRYFVKTSTRASKSSTIKRINRRYPYIHPGRKVRRHANIAISIDQSGSVSDAMLEAFYSELNKLSQLATFTVIPFDTRVAEDKIFIWKKGQSHKRERVLYGGTCFNAPTIYVNKNNFDGHIVLTDMYAPKPKRSNCQRMWMTTADMARQPYFKTNERVIAIEY